MTHYITDGLDLFLLENQPPPISLTPFVRSSSEGGGGLGDVSTCYCNVELFDTFANHATNHGANCVDLQKMNKAI
jgi:hypothetical protein